MWKVGARLSLAMVAGCISAIGAEAHHSFPATYNDGHNVRIAGKLAAFMFRNPHSFVHVLVEDEDGKVIRYAVEWAAASALSRQGITRSSFKPGDYVIIAGLPGRNAEDNRVLLKTLERPSDGLKWGFEEGQVVE
jgi:hypothetical protein